MKKYFERMVLAVVLGFGPLAQGQCPGKDCMAFWFSGNLVLPQWTVHCGLGSPPPCTCAEAPCPEVQFFYNDIIDLTLGHLDYTSGTLYRLVEGPGMPDLSGFTNLSTINSNLFIGITLPNHGDIRFSGFDPALLTVENRGNWMFLSDNDMLPFDGSWPIFYNYGLVRKSGGDGTTTISMNFLDSHGVVDAQRGRIVFAGPTNSFTYTRFTNATGQIVVANDAAFYGCQSDGGLVLAGGQFLAAPGSTGVNANLYGQVLWTGGLFGDGSPGSTFDSRATLTLVPGNRTALAAGMTFGNSGTLTGGTLTLETNSVLNNYGLVQDVNLMPGTSSSGGEFIGGTFRAGAGTNTIGAIQFVAGPTVDCGNGVLLFTGTNNTFEYTDLTGSSGAIVLCNGAAFHGSQSDTTNLVLAGGNFTSLRNAGGLSSDFYGTALWTGGLFGDGSPGSTFDNRATLTLVPGNRTAIAAGMTFGNSGTLTGGTLTLETNSVVDNYGLVQDVNLMPGTSGSGAFVNSGTFRAGKGTNTIGAIQFWAISSLDCGEGVLLFTGTNNSFEYTDITGGSGAVVISNGAAFYSCSADTTNLILAGGSFTALAGTPGINANLYGTALWTGGTFGDNSPNSSFDSRAVLTVTNGATIGIADQATFYNHGGLRGSAFIGGTNSFLYNYGTLTPGSPTGSLTYAGNFLQEPPGSLNLLVSGANTNQFGNLVVLGAATLGGQLTVTLTNGFQPVAGSGLRIVQAKSRTGAFSPVTLPLGMALSYDATGVSLVTTGTVPVQATAPAPAQGFVLSFKTFNGLTYTVETNAELRTLDWGVYTNFIGNGQAVELAFSTTNLPREFVRVSLH